mmetsp:Transcript_3189/g.7502  ORF Transcript_3189/g.7502 Transcript_3189/m.7502 type:complete len:351 (-) Transcript_3189:2556-3608(-)
MPPPTSVRVVSPSVVTAPTPARMLVQTSTTVPRRPHFLNDALPLVSRFPVRRILEVRLEHFLHCVHLRPASDREGPFYDVLTVHRVEQFPQVVRRYDLLNNVHPRHRVYHSCARRFRCSGSWSCCGRRTSIIEGRRSGPFFPLPTFTGSTRERPFWLRFPVVWPGFAGRDGEHAFDHVGRKLLGGREREGSLEPLDDACAVVPPPGLQRVLHCVVAERVLHQVPRMLDQFPQQFLPVLVCRVRHGHLQHTEPVRVGHQRRELVYDPLEGRPQRFLPHGLQALLYNVGRVRLQRDVEEAVEEIFKEKSDRRRVVGFRGAVDQGLEGVRAALVLRDGDDAVGRHRLQQSLAF